MKSVVMIPYYFPPEGSAGVYRPLRFVRQLATLGWETTVVTGHPYRYERYDPELVNHIPKETEIIRVGASDPLQALQAWRGKRLQDQLSEGAAGSVERIEAVHHGTFRAKVRNVMRTVESYYYVPDRAKPWIRPAVQTVREVCTSKHPIALWATVGPISAGVVAQHAAQLTNVPYVLDFRDPWELYYYESEMQRPKAVTRSAQRTMYKLFEGAQAVIFLFPRVAECYWQAYKGALDADKIHIIPNGYEGEIEDFRTPNHDTCNILYSGTLGSYRYDTLLEALQELKKTYPNLAKHMRFHFVGDGMNSLAREAHSFDISDIVKTAPPVSYDELKRLYEKTHAFLILGRYPERKGHELVAGAKLFGYFKARKPIIGILPQDETKDILANVGVETIAKANSVSEIVNVVRKVHEAWSEGRLSSLLPNAHACETYSSKPQTMALVRALEGLPPEAPFVPGKVNLPASLRETIEDKSLWYRKS